MFSNWKYFYFKFFTGLVISFVALGTVLKL